MIGQNQNRIPIFKQNRLCRCWLAGIAGGKIQHFHIAGNRCGRINMTKLILRIKRLFQQACIIAIKIQRGQVKFS